MGQSIAATAQVTREMKLPAVFFVLHQSVVTAAPQTNVGTFSAFSNFNPQSQIFTAGSNSQLSQTFSSSQDYGFQSLDYGLDTLLGVQGLGGAGFNGLATTGLDINTGAFDAFSAAAGGCDSFCESAKRLEAQSLNQFQTDLKIFQSQFAGVQSNSNFIPQTNRARVPLFVQGVNNNQIRPNSVKTLKPATPRPRPVPVGPISQPTFTKPKDRPINLLSRPSIMPTTTPISTTPETTILLTTTRTTTNRGIPNGPVITITPKKEENKNSNGVSIPVETTTRKSTKIRFTFNGKTIGGSKSTTKRSAENVGGFPISTFFNDEEEEEEGGSNFTVFDAVPS